MCTEEEKEAKREKSGGKEGLEKEHRLLSCLLQLSLSIDAVCLYKMGWN